MRTRYRRINQIQQEQLTCVAEAKGEIKLQDSMIDGITLFTIKEPTPAQEIENLNNFKLAAIKADEVNLIEVKESNRCCSIQ